MRDQRILVIKLGALGDMVQAMGPALAIRQHHPQAGITLLTTAAYADFARAAPYFDEVWIDTRPSLWRDPAGLMRLRRRLRAGRFERVYDLQTSDRSSFYRSLFLPGPMPEWSGIARGASHPHANPQRDFIHTIERQADQLKFAGIEDVPLPDLSWLDADLSALALDPAGFVLLVPGGAAHRPEKRWPIQDYAALAQWLAQRGLQSVILGGAIESPLATEIQAGAPAALDLTGKTDFAMIAALARRARRAVGNDTGPMHLIAATGCPATVLFSAASDPEITRPRGPDVTVLRRERLADLKPAEVAAALRLG
jgi:ADP-heptose:LPS heptosyltransferase